MQAVIFAGGFGTRMGESSKFCPKPMVEVAEMPVLFHLMNMFSHHAVTEFILCLGYMADYFKKYFSDRYPQIKDPEINHDGTAKVLVFGVGASWTVTLIDEGISAMTGGRLKQASYYLRPDEDFCVTYGDGLSDLDISREITFHREHGKLATVMAFQPRSPYGVLEFDEAGRVLSFQEKPIGKEWINAGFFVLAPGAIDFVQDFITEDSMVWEKAPLEDLTRRSQLCAYQHVGFWQGMDSQVHQEALQKLWDAGRAPWKVWTDAEEVRPAACAASLMRTLPAAGGPASPPAARVASVLMGRGEDSVSPTAAVEDDGHLVENTTW